MPLVTAETYALHDLMDRYAHYAPEYGRGLSNHLPMLLHAMHSLGASEKRMNAYAATYCARLEALNPSDADASDWRALRGRSDAYAALAQMFSSRIAGEGRDAVLRDVLPDLLPGVSTNAFHGLIRCGHAIAADHDDELARALAYWTSSYLRLLHEEDAAALPAPLLGLREWLHTAHDLASISDAELPLITLRMQAWAQTPSFATLALALRTDAETLPAFARLAARLYALTGNFTVLHMVTSSHAMLVLRPWLADESSAARWFGIALFAAIRAARITREQVSAALGAESIAALADEWPPLSWNELAEIAVASSDDHAAKIVYSSRALFEMLGGDVFQLAAIKGTLAQARASSAAPRNNPRSADSPARRHSLAIDQNRLKPVRERERSRWTRSPRVRQARLKRP